MPPTGAGSAIAVSYLNLLGHAVGWPSPESGAQRLTDAQVGYLHELDGELRTGMPAERIETPADGSPPCARPAASAWKPPR